MEGSIAFGLYLALLLMGAAFRFALRGEKKGTLASVVCVAVTAVGWFAFVPMGRNEGNAILVFLFGAFTLGVILCGLALRVFGIFQGTQKGT